jgi:hypothetical protein
VVVTRWLGDLTASLRRHWLAVTSLLGALVLIFFVGFGFGQRWGASRWGPFAEWFAGALTFAAVVVALRESARGQRARRVDHELTRRRECLKAVGDVWGALMQIGLDFTVFKNYLDDLPERFNANHPRPDNLPPEGTGEPFAEEIASRIMDFYTKWVQLVEPPLFVARALLQDTPLDAAMTQISGDIRKINNEVLPPIRDATISEQGRRPDTEPFDAAWKELMNRRQEHLDLAREHFSLSLNKVEQAALRRR